MHHPTSMLAMLVLTACSGTAGEGPGTASTGPSDSSNAAEGRRVQGYAALPEQDCIALTEIRDRQVVGQRAIFFDEGSRTLYRTEPVGSCAQLAPNARVQLLPARRDVPAPRDLCRGDLIRVTNDLEPNLASVCTVGAFTPYQRQEPGRDL